MKGFRSCHYLCIARVESRSKKERVIDFLSKTWERSIYLPSHSKDPNSTSTTSRTTLKMEAIKRREGSDLATESSETGNQPVAYLVLRLRRAQRQ